VSTEVVAALSGMKLELKECQASLQELVEARKFQGATSLSAAKDSFQDVDLYRKQEEMFKAKISICQK